MNKFILTSLILGTTTLAVLTGCKKDDSSSGNGSGTSKSTTDLLTGGSSRKWKQTSETINGTVTQRQPCEEDDRIILTKTGQPLTMDFGTLHCDSNEMNVSGTWALSNNDKTLTITITYMGTVIGTAVMDILAISDAQMTTREIDQGDTTVTILNVAN